MFKIFSKYICSVWRLAMRYDLFIYIYIYTYILQKMIHGPSNVKFIYIYISLSAKGLRLLTSSTFQVHLQFLKYFTTISTNLNPRAILRKHWFFYGEESVNFAEIPSWMTTPCQQSLYSVYLQVLSICGGRFPHQHRKLLVCIKIVFIVIKSNFLFYLVFVSFLFKNKSYDHTNGSLERKPDDKSYRTFVRCCVCYLNKIQTIGKFCRT